MMPHFTLRVIGRPPGVPPRTGAERRSRRTPTAHAERGEEGEGRGAAKSVSSNTPTSIEDAEHEREAQDHAAEVGASAAPKRHGGPAVATPTPRAPSSRGSRPAPRAAAHTDCPSSPATTALATVMAPRSSGAMAGLRTCRSFPVVRHLVLQIDGVAAPGRNPANMPITVNSGKVSTQPAPMPAPTPRPVTTAARHLQQKATDSADVDEPFCRLTAAWSISVIARSHSTCRFGGLQRGRVSSPRSSATPAARGSAARAAANGSGSATAPCTRWRRWRRRRGRPWRERCCAAPRRRGR